MARRTLLLLLVLAATTGAVCSTAGAALSWQLRTAAPDDVLPQRPSVGQREQEWRVVAVDPRHGGLVDLDVFDQGTVTVTLTYYSPAPQLGAENDWHDVGPVTTDGIGFVLRDVTLRRTGSGWLLDLDEPQSTAGRLHLSLAHAVPGPFAHTSWPVNTPSAPYTAIVQWAAPVATSAASGFLAWAGHRISLDGWRGYITHTWGVWEYGGGITSHWDQVVAETAGGGAWLLDGLEPGPGVSSMTRDNPRWTGVLAHAGPGGSWRCVAHVTRSGWSPAPITVGYQFVFPKTVTASCGGHRVTFTRQDRGTQLIAGFVAPGRASAGGLGLFWEAD